MYVHKYFTLCNYVFSLFITTFHPRYHADTIVYNNTITLFPILPYGTFTKS